MMVDALVQIQAAYKANKEEEERRNGDARRNRKTGIQGSRPIIARNIDSCRILSSKWFDQDEISIVCAVFESGFIVERRNTSSDVSNTYGIALWDLGYEKSKESKHLNIYTVVEENVHAFNIKTFWKAKTQIRISNDGDRYYPVNDEVAIRSKLRSAEKMKFSSEERFVCFCRYKNGGDSRQGPDRNWSLSNILARIRSLSVGGN